MWDRLLSFWGSDLWNFRLDELSGLRKHGYKALRVIALSISGFQKDCCTLRASSLTYYTLMSIVPILALAFSIARGFNLHEVLRQELLERFQENKAALTEMIVYADRIVNETRGGLLAGIGVVVLIWSAISLIGSMEAALNHIWEVEKMRSWRRIIGEYLALLLIAPILFVVSNSAGVFVATYLEDLSDLRIFCHLFYLSLLLFAQHPSEAFFGVDRRCRSRYLLSNCAVGLHLLSNRSKSIWRHLRKLSRPSTFFSLGSGQLVYLFVWRRNLL